jgi:centromere protein C
MSGPREGRTWICLKNEQVYYNTNRSRRTGITLKEGRIDEHGMEELDGVFSSPEKSPMRSNGIYTGNDTMMGSEGMSMDEGTQSII